MANGKWAVRIVRSGFISLGVLAAGLVAPLAPAESFLVKDGQPRAQIVIAETPARMQKLAAEELRDYVRKISGAELVITNAPSGEFPVTIYVGKSEYTDKMKIDLAGLVDDGYRVVSGDNTLVLIGEDTDYVPREPYARNAGDRERAAQEWDAMTGARWACPGGGISKGYSRDLDAWAGDGRGSLNAVYDLLQSLGVRWYFPGDFGECVPEQTTIALPVVDRTVNPDFAIRTFGGSGYAFGKTNRDIALWCLRLGLRGERCTVGSHGIDPVIHHENTRQAHPEYYMLVKGERDIVSRGGKPCLSAKGLMQSNIEFGRAYFDIYDMDVLSVMPTDGYVTLCQCELCKDRGTPERGYNGAMSDYVWSYVNGVATELNKTHPDKRIICGAYTAYQLPPLSIDKLSPNVGVQIAQARRAFTDPEARKKMLELRGAWLPKLSGAKPFTLHDNYSSGGDAPFPMYYPHIIAEDMRSLKGLCRGEYIEENSLRPRDEWPPVTLAINHLNIYVTARLWWDADQDVDALLNEYYTTFYGPAAKAMRSFIEFSEANWPKMNKDAELITKALDLMDKARAAAGGDSIYAQRVALVDEYLTHLKQLRDKVAIGRKDNPRARIVERRGGQKLVMDGRLDDEFWAYGVTYKLRELETGKKPALTTWFKAAWRNDDLYFGVYCEEDDTTKLDIGTTNNDDTAIWNGDTVEIFLETQNHAYYHIAVNPAGAMMDLDWKLGMNTLWTSDAELATYVGTNYWSLEIRIPVADEMQEENLPNQLVSGRRPTITEPWYFNIGRARKRESGNEGFMFSPLGSRRFPDPKKFGELYME